MYKHLLQTLKKLESNLLWELNNLMETFEGEIFYFLKFDTDNYWLTCWIFPLIL